MPAYNGPYEFGSTTIRDDRLLLFRDSWTHKDDTWTSQDAKEKWELACEILAESDLTSDSENFEENERVFSQIMRKEPSGKVRCRGFGVTPSMYYPTSSRTGCSRTSANEFVRSNERLTTMENNMGQLNGTVSHLQGTVNHLQCTVDEMYAFIKEQSLKEN